jgi:hypothetical protein
VASKGDLAHLLKCAKSAAPDAQNLQQPRPLICYLLCI